MRTNGYRATVASNAGAGNGASTHWPGGRGTFAADATWGGGSAKLQLQLPNDAWVDIDGTTLSASGTKAFHAPAGRIRCVIATATGVYAYVIATAD